MGVPAHFSLELPRRCMNLINELLPTVGSVFADDDRRELNGLIRRACKNPNERVR
jgi:hypothetical protein